MDSFGLAIQPRQYHQVVLFVFKTLSLCSIEWRLASHTGYPWVTTDKKQRQSEKANPALKSDPPRTFCLTVNYRSHTGIVNCAHSIVELIQRYWPYSIDSLAPEKGLIAGPPPVIIAEQNSDDIQFVGVDLKHVYLPIDILSGAVPFWLKAS